MWQRLEIDNASTHNCVRKGRDRYHGSLSMLIGHLVCVKAKPRTRNLAVKPYHISISTYSNNTAVLPEDNARNVYTPLF